MYIASQVVLCDSHNDTNYTLRGKRFTHDSMGESSHAETNLQIFVAVIIKQWCTIPANFDSDSDSDSRVNQKSWFWFQQKFQEFSKCFIQIMIINSDSALHKIFSVSIETCVWVTWLRLTQCLNDDLSHVPCQLFMPSKICQTLRRHYHKT